MVVRTHIKVNRKPITILTKKGCTKGGGWFVFDIPKGQTAPPIDIKNWKNERVLYCPYCATWHLFVKGLGRNEDEFYCTGACGWAHTNDFWVKSVNKIWSEGINLYSIKKTTKKKGDKK